MNTKFTFVTAKIINCVAIYLLFIVKAFAQLSSNAPAINPEYAQFLTNAPPSGFATRLDYVKSFSDGNAILNAYRAGVLNKGETMVALDALEAKAPMDTYGKVIDQYGQPVVGVKIQSHLETGIGSYQEQDTETDSQGLFSYVGIHGSGLIFHLIKPGYIFNEKFQPERPRDYIPDANSPLTFTMWRQHGAELMKHSQLHAYIPCDGSPTRFNIFTGKQDGAGDLTVSLTRDPVNIIRTKPFNWILTLTVSNGGFQEITNPYPNEAPTGGYQPQITFNFQADTPNWTANFTHGLYFTAQSGQVYGRMMIDTMANFQPPPTLFDAEIYANPAGSRNLEFDPNKRIH